MTGEQFSAARQAGAGWCCFCSRITQDGVGPVERNAECPECGEAGVVGIDLALLKGFVEIEE
ncbi:MAG: hypothetical protein WC551_08600 [Patescibacteria group bacterium]